MADPSETQPLVAKDTDLKRTQKQFADWREPTGRMQPSAGDVKGELAEGRDEAESYTSAKYTYDPHVTLGNLMRWRGTVLPGILWRPTFWINVIVFVATSVCKHEYPGECGHYLLDLQIGDLAGTLMPLLTFFLAFFTAACYGRFVDQYTHLKNIEGLMRSVGIMVRNGFVEGKDKAMAEYDMIELFRYLSAAYYLLFCRLYEGDSDAYDLESALEEGLVTLEESALLETLPEGMQWFKVLSWAFGHTERACVRHDVEPKEKAEIKGYILKIRETMNAVTYTFQMPVPLAYYHVITVLTLFTTILISYSCGYGDKPSPDLAWLLVLLLLFGFLGMREVAVQLADPFGDDDCDLPVDVYVMNIMKFMTMFVEDDSELKLPLNTMTFRKDEAGEPRYWAHGKIGNKRHLSVILRHGQRAHRRNIERHHLGTVLKYLLAAEEMKELWGFLHWRADTVQQQQARAAAKEERRSHSPSGSPKSS